MIEQMVFRICDRPHEGDVDAVVTERLAHNGQKFLLDLCQQHSDELAALVGDWTRAATASGAPSMFDRAQPVTVQRKRSETYRAVDLPTGKDLPEPELASVRTALDNLHRWQLSAHAHLRCREREISPQQALEAAQWPQVCVPSRRGTPKVEERTRGAVTAVVNFETNEILTVMPSKSAELGRELAVTRGT